MDATYFTCTLGQAVSHQSKSYTTISEFIKHKAACLPDLPVIGFYEVGEKSTSQWKPLVLTFEDIQRGTATTAKTLLKHLDGQKGQTVALLCPSSADFLFTWLALIWLGCPALLIAPQCSPSAIAQLCKSCNVEYLVYDKLYGDLATKATTEAATLEDYSLRALLLPSPGMDVLQANKPTSTETTIDPVSVKDGDIAYLHHTSGTSSGTPKPIPQSHRGALGVLPNLDGRGTATFTTTPLYHGGIADLFRAWTSDALIWLFPGRDVPITGANTRKCLDIAAKWAAKAPGPTVKYFSSVPYVLQMMTEDEEGMRHLQQMDIVGVGGAALPAEVGDRLVKDNVHLISRFGSAECGFLMSSHRDYLRDNQWQYLRSPPDNNYLHFEPRDDGLSELVIQSHWPHMAKRNREDGSYATADLFAPHPRIHNAWRYHSRADSQLTLITGKKFDPAPLEDAIRASAPTVLEDVLIFGNGKPYPGALLFRTKTTASMSDADLITKLAPVMEELNRESQSHARISGNMLIPMPYLEVKLEKSSKGTILRAQAQVRFAEDIAAAYEQLLPNGSSSTDVPDTDISESIRNIISNVVGVRNSQENGIEELTDKTDLFGYGVDSVASIQIRNSLSRLLPRGTALPLTVVQDMGTISQLSDLVLRLRSGNGAEMVKSRERDDESQHRLMLDLVQECRVCDDSPARLELSEQQYQSNHAELTVLLTGPTGSLGAHILSQLLSDSSISTIHLLVRGATSKACRERVLKALSSRNLPVPAIFNTKVQIHSCKLADSKLGLLADSYKKLAEEVDVVIHLAWSVNFLLPLRSFTSTHLAGITNLIKFALSSPEKNPPPRLIFCSSVAAVSNHTSSSKSPLIPEKVLKDPSVSGSTGYARSKWVAEQLCAHAHNTTRLNNCISIARVGQLSGATDTGVWAASEAYPLMQGSLGVTGCLPDLDAARREQGILSGETLGWLPVDIAARAFVEDLLGQEEKNINLKTVEDGLTGEDVPVHHVLNPSTETTWSHLLRYLSHVEKFEVVPVQEWLSRLEALQTSDDERKKTHPALKLLGFWKTAYGSTGSGSGKETAKDETEGALVSGRRLEDAGSDKMNEQGKVEDKELEKERDEASSVAYEMTKTYASMPSLRVTDGVMTEEYILKLWAWIKENV